MKTTFLQKSAVLSILIVATLFTFSCSRGGGSGQQGPQGFGGFGGGGGFARTTTVEARDIQRSSISDQIRAYGTVRAQDNVRVTPQVSERIMRIFVDLGDTVRAGQVLAKLNDANFTDQVLRDEAQVEQTRIAAQRDSVNFNRQQELFGLGLLSQAELDNARAQYFATRANYRAAVASLTQSRQNLSYTEVRSPVNGVVTRRNASPGDLAGSGQAIYEISNLVGYEVRLYLPLGDWRNTRLGQEVELRHSGATDLTTKGTVSRISPELDPVTGLGEVVISLTSRGEGIFPGVLLESRINVQTKNNVIVIPRSSMVENVQTVLEPESNVIRLSRTYSAFVSQGDTIAVRRNLELGVQQGDRIEVLSGLSEGEKLIITGQTSLEDGSRIRISGAPRFTGAGAGGGGLDQGARPGGPTGQPQTNAQGGRNEAVADTARFNQRLRNRGIDPADTAAVRQAREQMQRQRSGN